jgi:cephalosporin-C deacetylase-like acetyl esterase
MRFSIAALFLALLLVPAFPAARAADAPATAEFDVLPAELDGGPKSQMLHRYLNALNVEALDRRTVEYEKIKTEADARAYQAKMKAFFVEQLGGFPERTPLNAQTVVRREADGYSFEKIIFESRPNFHVTAILFLPPGKGPFPGVIVPCGHSAGGKSEKKYQQACILLAKNGIAALIYDPLGQGERHQVLLPDGNTQPPNHTVLGVSCIPLGTSFAQFRIWDGMRALDYLASRPEVDPKRLGCTGNSGGGTLTSYLMALDERIECAAPSCYITSHRRLLEKAGPQDAEQNIFNQIGFGMTMSDYVLMRAPKPTLICTATRDMFDIRGSWDTYREAKRFYARFGLPERVDLVETDEGHGFHTQLREGAARWMIRWLADNDAPLTGKPAVDQDPAVIDPTDALATPEGQVLKLAGERTVFDINADADDRLIAARNKKWDAANLGANLEANLDEVRRLAGIRPLEKLPAMKAQEAGVVARKGYQIRKLALTWEAGITLPAVAFVPDKPVGDTVLFVDGAGKNQAAAEGGELDRLAQDGSLVVAVDLRGLGELSVPVPVKPSPIPADSKTWFEGYLVGRSHIGMRAEDVLSAARWLRAYDLPTGKRRAVRVVGVGQAGPAVLHAAALESELFAKVELRQSLSDWSRVVRDRAGCGLQLTQLVHGALRVYDLPDLARTLGKKLTIVDPRGSQGEPLSAE